VAGTRNNNRELCFFNKKGYPKRNLHSYRSGRQKPLLFPCSGWNRSHEINTFTTQQG